MLARRRGGSSLIPGKGNAALAVAGSERRPGPAVSPPPPTWLRAPAGSVRASLGPASPPARTSPHLAAGSCPALPPPAAAPPALAGRLRHPHPLPFPQRLRFPVSASPSPPPRSPPLAAPSSLLAVSSPFVALAPLPGPCSPSGCLPRIKPPPPSPSPAPTARRPSRRDQIRLLPSLVPRLRFHRITLLPAPYCHVLRIFQSPPIPPCPWVLPFCSRMPSFPNSPLSPSLSSTAVTNASFPLHLNRQTLQDPPERQCSLNIIIRLSMTCTHNMESALP